MMLIHPHADWRNRWTQVLNDMPGCELVAAVSNFREANPRLGAGDYDVVWIAQSENDEMEAAAAHFPVRVVITEGNLPEKSKKDSTRRRICSYYPECRVCRNFSVTANHSGIPASIHFNLSASQPFYLCKIGV